MRSGFVFCNALYAGILTEEYRGIYVFRYEDMYYTHADTPAISITLPKTRQEYRSSILFPVFANMLSEGANRILQSRLLKIDENDDFGFLLATAQYDTIGALTVQPMTTPYDTLPSSIIMMQGVKK